MAGAPALAEKIDSFEDGTKDAVVDLKAPECSEVINITLPAECYVIRATLNVSNLILGYSSPGFPEPVQIFLDDSMLWEFNGTGYGALGRQDRFINGSTEWRSGFGAGGGENGTKVRLPKRAAIQNATLAAESSGPVVFEEWANFTGERPSERYGQSVSGAGDVNRDGYDDVIVGSPMNQAMLTAGRAFLYFGGPRTNNLPNVTLTGQGPDDEFGYSVSDAGDVNNDSYPDVIVGAPENDAGGSGAGRAYIFYGGASMDNTPDVILTGTAQTDRFGYSVSGAGDLNGDGYDDVVVGAPFSNAGGRFAGKVHVFFGAKKMGTTANVTITGTFDYEEIGRSVSSAGDVNNDGYDDLIIGLNDNTYGTNCGAMHIYHGGASMDNIVDVNITGTAKGDDFGRQVSCAGDVNNDGYSDVIVGAMDDDSGGINAGAAHVFFGGNQMNSTTDVKLVGSAEADYFGFAVSGAGDLNRDGFDDVVVGAYYNDASGPRSGQAYVYYGGAAMDNVTDLKLDGPLTDDNFGWAVSGAGDMDNDGYGDIIVGAPKNDAGGYDTGTAFVHRAHPAIRDPSVSLGPIAIWSKHGYINGTNLSRDFGPELNDLLRKTAPSGSDGYGNSYADLSLRAAASSCGNLTIARLEIIYTFETTLPEFTDRLNQFISSHKAEKDAAGNLKVGLRTSSKTPGKLMLDDLSIAVDRAPALREPIPDRTMPEDSADPEVLDLYDYFVDDYDAADRLSFSLVSATNASMVKVEIVGNRYLSADALEGEGNDNWTGEVALVVEAADHRALKTVSNPFRLVVENENDAPVITSQPALRAVGGQEYIYQATAADGDNDTLTYGLFRKPGNMTIDSATGLVRWIPSRGGAYDATVTASDGVLTCYQDFRITVPNRPPRTTAGAAPTAYVLEPYALNITAADDDQDPLVFSLLSNIEGMTIDPRSGRLAWVPSQPGVYYAAIRISDGTDDADCQLNITVLQRNRPPKIYSTPATSATVGLVYAYDANATDIDGDLLSFIAVEIPSGMSFDNATGRMTWTPAATGNFWARLKVVDGRGGEGLQEFVISVKARERSTLEFTAPAEGGTVAGALAVSGKAHPGTLPVVQVQIRVDAGDWVNATGNGTWSYMLDTTKLKNGKHTLQARAYDGMDYSDIANRTITVDNQKAAGKGFVPGFTMIVVPMAVAAALVMIGRRRRTGG